MAESKRAQNPRQRTGKARLLARIGREIRVWKLLANFLHAAIQLLNHALAGNIPKITLPVSRIDELDTPIHGLIRRQRLEGRQIIRRVGARKIPCLRLDLQVQFPIRILPHRVHHELREVRWIMAVKSAVEAIREIGRLRHGGACAQANDCRHASQSHIGHMGLNCAAENCAAARHPGTIPTLDSASEPRADRVFRPPRLRRAAATRARAACR